MALKGVVRVSNGLDKGMFSAVCMNNKGGRMRMELIKE